MRYAIFADIHNHTSALSRVLDHAAGQGVNSYFCLGDVGIDDCVEKVRAVGASTVFGNWEVSNWRYLSAENRQWALDLPPMRKKAQCWLTHAGLQWPQHLATLANLNESRYNIPMSTLFPYLHYESDALWETIATLTQTQIPLLFHGHTHRQTVWCFDRDNELRRMSPGTVHLQAGQILIVGVGSVGRPVDSSKASYVIFDTAAQQIEMIRL